MENNNGDDRLLTRIRKLLNLAEGTRHQDEAEAAMLKAQLLLAENDWTISDLKMDAKEKEVIEGALDQNGKPIHSWKHLIAEVVSHNFRITIVIRRSWGEKYSHIVYIGLKEDVEVATEVTEFAFRWFEKNWKIYLATWKKENKDTWLYSTGGQNTSRTKRMKNAYAIGFYEGLKAKFQTQVEQHALVLSQHALVKEHVDKMNLKKGTPFQMKTGSAWSHEAFGQGKEDGKRFHTGKERSELT